MTRTKTCEVCGVEFNRPRDRSDAEWRRRRFCGHPCRMSVMPPPKNRGGYDRPRMDMRERVRRNCVPLPHHHHRWPGCWLWTSSVVEGRAFLRVVRQGKKRERPAARCAYEAIIGAVPEGLVLDHLCANKLCVNPWHLEPVTPAENSRRGTHGRPRAKPAPRTHCPNGHEYTEENTAPRSIGGRPARRCRICRRASKKRYETQATPRVTLDPGTPPEEGRGHPRMSTPETLKNRLG